MDIVERLRQSWNLPDAATCAKAADEIERLREEIASCTADIAREVSEGNRYMLEAAGLREQLATCRKDTALLNEATLISAAYDFTRTTCVFAADDIEYDLFAAGWKAAIDAAMKEQS